MVLLPINKRYNMKFLKLIFLIFISLEISCSTINEKSILDNESNVFTVKQIIENYLNLEKYLNNKSISDTFLLNFGFKYEIPSLKDHIIKNKFYEGYRFEITDSITKIFILTHNFTGEKPLFDTNNYVISNLIKIRSNFNNEIIWFVFKYYKDQKLWKLRFAHYCNNYNERALGEVDSCDKK